MRLLMFGCSLTQICGIPDHLQSLGYDVVDFSESAGSNQLQIARYHDAVAQHRVRPSDILVWQITNLQRRWKRVCQSEFSSTRDKFMPANLPSKHHYWYVDNGSTVDILSNACWDGAVSAPFDHHIMLNFLYDLHQKHSIMVWVGHAGFVEPGARKFMRALTRSGMLICQEFFTAWCARRHLPFAFDEHPAPEAGQAYCDQCLLPLIQSFGPPGKNTHSVSWGRVKKWSEL